MHLWQPIVMMTRADRLSSAHTCIGLPGAGQLIFVASYYDYVRLRNFLKEQGVEVAALSEYAPPKEAAPSALPLHGRAPERGAAHGALAFLQQGARQGCQGDCAVG